MSAKEEEIQILQDYSSMPEDYKTHYDKKTLHKL